MARSSPSPSPSLLLCLFLGLLFFAKIAAAAAARGEPAKKEAAAAAKPDKKVDCLGVRGGTVLIPGAGRYKIRSRGRTGLRGLDHSGPAAANPRFLPGGDDTFVPNPGFEVPNPFRRGIP